MRVNRECFVGVWPRSSIVAVRLTEYRQSPLQRLSARRSRAANRSRFGGAHFSGRPPVISSQNLDQWSKTVTRWTPGIVAVLRIASRQDVAALRGSNGSCKSCAMPVPCVRAVRSRRRLVEGSRNLRIFFVTISSLRSVTISGCEFASFRRGFVLFCAKLCTWGFPGSPLPENWFSFRRKAQILVGFRRQSHRRSA